MKKLQYAFTSLDNNFPKKVVYLVLCPTFYSADFFINIEELDLKHLCSPFNIRLIQYVACVKDVGYLILILRGNFKIFN